MAFRNDREALAAKVRALQEENEKLREQLENALEELDNGTDQAARLRAELERVRVAAARPFEHYSSTTQAATRSRGESDFLTYRVAGLLFLFAAAAFAISRFTGDDVVAFILYMGIFSAVVLTVIAILVWRAVRDFARDWKL